jgi:hypothetical protein
MLFVDGLIACFIWNDLHHPKLDVEEIAGRRVEGQEIKHATIIRT